MMRRFFYALILTLLSVVCTGCSIKEKENYGDTSQIEDSPVIRVFDKASKGSRFDDRIAQEIQKKTGVKIEMVNSTEAPEEKAKLMLANKDYPDIVIVSLLGGNMAEKYVEAGAFIPLDDYIETMGPDIKTMYGDTLDSLRREDGHIYYLTSWYGKDLEPLAGFQIRYDILKELAGQERADSSEVFTQEEIVELLRAFKKRYPEIDGQESLPFIFNKENSGRTLFGMYGMKYYHETEDGSLQMIYKSPKYLDRLLFLNQLYREGFLEKNWEVNKNPIYEEKLESGRVFMTSGAYWNVNAANAVLKETCGPEAQFYSYKVLGEGVKTEETTYNGRNSLGWDVAGITENCEDVEAALKVINFLASEEGQYLTLWGIEGEDWDMVDGKHVPRKDILEAFLKDPDRAREETGIRKWTWFTKNGNGADGTPYDMAMKYSLSETAKRAYTNMGDDYWDTAPYTGIAPAIGTEEAVIQQKIAAIERKYSYLAISAETPMEVEQVYEDMLLQMEAEGIERVEKILTEKYKKNIKK